MRRLSLVLVLLVVPATALADVVPERVEISRHRLHARLGGGVALVSEELTLEADGDVDTPTQLALVLPEGGVLLALEACGPTGACRAAEAVPDAEVVFDTARYGYRARWAAPLVMATQGSREISLDVAGLDAGASIVRVAWSARTSTLGGVDRVLVPEREREVEITLASSTLDALSVDGDAGLQRASPNAAFELAGTNRPGGLLERCSVGSAGFLRVVAPLAAPSPEPLVIFLDLSPTALLRLDELRAVLRATLGAVPAETQVRIVGFARTARVLAIADAGSLRARDVALPDDLGPSTSAAAALALLRTLELPAGRMLWLGDGGLSWGTAETDAMTTLRRMGLEVVALAGPGLDARIGLASVVDPIGDPRALARTLPGLVGPPEVTVVDGTTLRTRAGSESVVVLAREPAGATPPPLPDVAYAPHLAEALGAATDAPALLTLDPIDREAARKTVRGRLAIFRAGGGLAPPGRRIVRCSGMCSVSVRGGVSRPTLARIVRRTIGPRVRGCFAEQRVRRPEWQGRATLVLGLEGPEVAYADVQTDSPELRTCILGAVDHVLPPVGDGAERDRVVIHYPFVYVPPEAPAEPAQVPLADDTSAALEGLFGDEATVPTTDLLAPGIVQN